MNLKRLHDTKEMYDVYALFFTSVYLAASFQEWFAHKYLMHQTSYSLFDSLYKNHLLHHQTTLNDYTMKHGNAEYICFDLFTMDGMVQTVVVYLSNVGVFYALFYPAVSMPVITGSILVMIFVNIWVWNVVHSYVHGFDSSVICFPMGVPNRFILNNSFVKWLSDNHRKHHDNPKTHYNIVFPGADSIMGTRTTT